MTILCDIVAVGEDVQVSMPLSFSLIGELAHFCIEYMYELHDFYWEVQCVCVCVFSLSFFHCMVR